MPTWITDENAKLHPAKEIVNLINRSNSDITIEITDDSGKKFKKTIKPGMPYVYEGPDRAALFELWEMHGRPTEKEMKEKLENGTLTIGDGFRTDNTFLEAYAKAKNALGFNNVDDYLKYLGYDAEKVKNRFKEKASVITMHELPSRIEEIKKLGGGSDTVANKSIRYGGFGEPPAN